MVETQSFKIILMNFDKHAFRLYICVFFIYFLMYSTSVVRLTNAQSITIFNQRLHGFFSVVTGKKSIKTILIKLTHSSILNIILLSLTHSYK